MGHRHTGSLDTLSPGGGFVGELCCSVLFGGLFLVF